jgi:hypothetical protein
MTLFRERQAAFEKKFAHDAEMQFRAVARRDKLIGLWAAGLLGRTGPEAEAYAQDVVREDCAEAGHECVVRKLAADLGDRADEDTIRARMDALMHEAKAQLLDEAVY